MIVSDPPLKFDSIFIDKSTRYRHGDTRGRHACSRLLLSLSSLGTLHVSLSCAVWRRVWRRGVRPPAPLGRWPPGVRPPGKRGAGTIGYVIQSRIMFRVAASARDEL